MWFMNRKNKPNLLIISLDAVPSDTLDSLASRPNMARIVRESVVHENVTTVFPSNTYPVHCSIVSGKPPAAHGVISNTEPCPKKHPKWVTDARAIQCPTIMSRASENGLSVATVMWPVTGHSRHINWNIPELMPMPGKNIILEQLKAGSVFTQLSAALRHRGKLKAIEQPYIDDFATAAMCDILRSRKPNLALVHLVCFDAYFHKYGRDEVKLNEAMDSLDAHVGELLGAAGDGYSVITLSDHGQCTITRSVTPNDILVDMALLTKRVDEYFPTDSECFIECLGGSAYLHAGSLDDGAIRAIKDEIARSEGFQRFTSNDEDVEAGRAHLAFGYVMAEGFSADAHESAHKGNHGYPTNLSHNKVFYTVRTDDTQPARVSGGSVLDISREAMLILGEDLER